MGMNDIIFSPANLSGNSQSCYRVNFPSHSEGKGGDPFLNCLMIKTTARLADQMGTMSPLPQTLNEIESLLLTTPPSGFGIDMESSERPLPKGNRCPLLFRLTGEGC
jgi:hypothetical protein